MNRSIRHSALAALAALLAAAPLHAARDGELDRSFGTQGKATLAFPGELYLDYTGLVDLALLPNGQMLVAGTVINASGDDDFAVMRLQADGALDVGFGSNGGRRVGFDRAGGSLDDLLVSLAVQTDGKILLAGTARLNANGEDDDMAVARLTAAGQLDSSFGTGGRALVPFNLGPAGDRSDQGTRMALQDDGKILVVGSAQGADGAFDLALVRLTTSGQRDTSFDGDGRVTIDFGPDYEAAQGLNVRPLAEGGRILVIGLAQRFSPSNVDFAMARLNADGSLDTGFGNGGKAAFDFAVGGGLQDVPYDFVELSDGKLMLCGTARVNAPSNDDYACMRFLANGTPDPEFAAVLVPFDRGDTLSDVAVALRIDTLGRYLLAGQVRRGAGNYDTGLARLLPDGSLDPSFGNNGTAVYNSCVTICVPDEYDNFATALALQPDGKIVHAGWVADTDGDYRFHLMRVFGDVIFSDGFED